MAHRVHGLALAFLTIVAAGCKSDIAATDSRQAKEEAPSSTGPTLEQVANKAPAVLYFIKSSCGSNPMAIPLVNRIYDANGKSGRFFAVIDTDQKGAADWAKEWNAEFPIIPDPDKKIIKQYGIEASQTGIQVDKDLRETKRFGGYGREALTAMNASLGSGKVDLAGAPESGFG